MTIINGLDLGYHARYKKALCYLTHDIVRADNYGSTKRAVWTDIMRSL